MEKDEYEKAWDEGGEDGPIENAVEAANKKAKAKERDEYLTAYAELDDDKKDDSK
jgi:hypothetical protein